MFPSAGFITNMKPAFACSNLTIETQKQGVNYEYISHVALLCLLLTLSIKLPVW